MKFDDLQSSAASFWIKIVLLLFLMAVIFAIVALSWVPPVSRDALTHHLAVPKLYLQQGSIHEIPSVIFSYYPMNLDLLYMIPLYFGNDIIPKFIHFAFALLTAWLIFSYLRKRLNAIWAGGGALFFLSLPIIVKLSITVYVDLGLVFFSTASLMAMFRWVESRFRLRYLMLSACCCGLALGIKYNGLIVLFLLTVFVPLLYTTQIKNGAVENATSTAKESLSRQLRAVGAGAFFCLMALMVFSPWMIRNYIWTDNPIYPLYNSYFNPQKAGPAMDSQPEDAEVTSTAKKKDLSGWGSFAIRKVVYREAWWEIALIPVRIFFQGRDDNPKYFDGRLNPFLLLLPIFAFLRLKSNPADVKIEKKILFSFAVLFILYAYFKTDMRIRYIAPAIPPLVILATFGLYRIHELIARHWPQGRGRRAAITVALLSAVMFTFNGLYIIHQFKLVDPFGYISGRVDRDAYIAKYRAEYPIIQYANGQLAADAKILVLFMGNRRYYSDRELIFGTGLFRAMAKNVDSAPGMLEVLHKRGFSHLLIRYDLFNKWTDKQFNDREKKMLKAFFEKGAKPLLSKNGYGLFELNFNH